MKQLLQCGGRRVLKIKRDALQLSLAQTREWAAGWPVGRASITVGVFIKVLRTGAVKLVRLVSIVG